MTKQAVLGVSYLLLQGDTAKACMITALRLHLDRVTPFAQLLIRLVLVDRSTSKDIHTRARNRCMCRPFSAALPTGVCPRGPAASTRARMRARGRRLQAVALRLSRRCLREEVAKIWLRRCILTLHSARILRQFGVRPVSSMSGTSSADLSILGGLGQSLPIERRAE